MEAELTNNNYTKDLCALEIGEHGVAYARVTYSNQNLLPPLLKDCEFYPHENLSQLPDTLASIVSKYNLKENACNWVLNPKYYRLILTSPPNVSINECKEALRWQIKDMVDYSPDDMTLDVFVPPAFNQTNSKKIYAVVTKTSFLKQIAKRIQEADLNLVAIDIKEFAIRNLLTPIATPEKAQVFLHLDEVGCLIVIVKNRQVHFSRHSPISSNFDYDQPGILKLIHEIQRSLDYYINELHQAPPEECFIVADTKRYDSCISTIAENITPIALTSLPLDRIITQAPHQSIEPSLLTTCHIAIGAALRNDEK